MHKSKWLSALIVGMALTGCGGAAEVSEDERAEMMDLADQAEALRSAPGFFRDSCWDHYLMCRTYDTYENCRKEFRRCVGLPNARGGSVLRR